MSGASKVLTQEQLDKTLLENLNDKSINSSLQTLLNTALQNKLSSYFKTNQQIQQAIARIQNIDFSKEANTTVRDFLTKNVGNSLTDSQAKQLFTNSLLQIPQNLTLGNLLGLGTPINNNPIFQGLVQYSNANYLLETTSLPPDLLSRVLVTYQKYSYNPSQSFWDDIGKNNDLKPYIVDLKFAILLGNLVGNVSLIKEIQALRKAGDANVPQNVVNVPQLLVRVNWNKVITSGVASGAITLPSNIKGSNEDEKIQNYIISVSNIVDAQYPTAAFFRDFENYVQKPLDPKSSVSPQLGKFRIASSSFVKFFTGHMDVDLRTINVWSYLKDPKNNAFEGIDMNHPEFTSMFLMTQRLFRITTNLDKFVALLNGGFESAYEIARVPKYNFVKNHGNNLGGKQEAQKIHDNATQVASRSLHLFANHSKLVNNLYPAFVANHTVKFGSPVK